MLRITKITLVATVALFLLIGAFFNVYDWSGTMGAVAATTSMATFEGGRKTGEQLPVPWSYGWERSS